MDAFYTQPICDVARNLAGIWGRNFPGQTAEIVYLPQNANSKHAVAYLRDEYARVQGELERIIELDTGDGLLTGHAYCLPRC